MNIRPRRYSINRSRQTIITRRSIVFARKGHGTYSIKNNNRVYSGPSVEGPDVELHV